MQIREKIFVIERTAKKILLLERPV